jgi:hypothetical protein
MTPMPATLLPLDTFRQLLEYHPYHFWQLFEPNLAPITNDCNRALAEYSWQRNDATGRAAIRRAIAQAEAVLQQYLGYDVAPTYRQVELAYPALYQTGLVRVGAVDAAGMAAAVKLPGVGYIEALGTPAYTSIQAGVAVVYSDSDGDGLNDTATWSAATTATDPTQLGGYVPQAQRTGLDTSLSEAWRIAPAQVTISGGVATFKAPAWVMVKPSRYEGISAQPLDAANSANFLSSVDVVQRAPDGAAQATLIWDQRPYPVCCVAAGSSDPAAVATATARVGIRDGRLGLVSPVQAVYDASTGQWSTAWWGCAGWRAPDRVIVNAYAGYPLQGQAMDSLYATTVFRLALAELARPLCACDKANKERYEWQLDLARTGGNADEAFGLISTDDLSNPLGTRRGHIAAWRLIKQLRQLPAFAI